MSKNATFQSGADFWGPGTCGCCGSGTVGSWVSIRCGFLGSGDERWDVIVVRNGLVSIRCGFLGSGDWARRL